MQLDPWRSSSRAFALRDLTFSLSKLFHSSLTRSFRRRRDLTRRGQFAFPSVPDSLLKWYLELLGVVGLLLGQWIA